MPDEHTAATQTHVCPTCRNGSGAGPSLYGAGGAPLAADAHADAPRPQHTHAPREAGPDPSPSGPGPAWPWQIPADSLHFWQGLAAGLAAGIVILFLVALAA